MRSSRIRALLLEAFCVLLGLSPLSPGLAQPAMPLRAESRDAALGFIGTMNFLVGRIGRDCLQTAGRPESAQELVQSWQQRNAKYVNASAGYMDKILGAALSEGGTERRDQLLREITTPARACADSMLQGWFQKGAKDDVCKRVLGWLDRGGFDISPNVPMYAELEALVKWSQCASCSVQ
jgi:hypothetical protein